MVEPIDVFESLKLQNYLNLQNLNVEEMAYLDKVDLSNLMLKSEFDQIKSEVERYQKLKAKVENGEGDVILQADEMRRLANDVLASTGRDINTIELSQLDTITEVERLLQKSGIKSNNDLVVRFSDDHFFGKNDYVLMRLAEPSDWGKYGINTGARMAITKSGHILTIRNALYEK